jgi:hypothetical protein
MRYESANGIFNTIGSDQINQIEVLKEECDLLDDLHNYFWKKWEF